MNSSTRSIIILATAWTTIATLVIACGGQGRDRRLPLGQSQTTKMNPTDCKDNCVAQSAGEKPLIDLIPDDAIKLNSTFIENIEPGDYDMKLDYAGYAIQLTLLDAQDKKGVSLKIPGEVVRDPNDSLVVATGLQRIDKSLGQTFNGAQSATRIWTHLGIRKDSNQVESDSTIANFKVALDQTAGDVILNTTLSAVEIQSVPTLSMLMAKKSAPELHREGPATAPILSGTSQDHYLSQNDEIATFFFTHANNPDVVAANELLISIVKDVTINHAGQAKKVEVRFWMRYGRSNKTDR